jgi:site-specific recombinase XerD
MNATRRFSAWCERRRIAQLAQVRPFHVAALLKDPQREFTAPTVKQHLSALRMLFDGS